MKDEIRLLKQYAELYANTEHESCKNYIHTGLLSESGMDNLRECLKTTLPLLISFYESCSPTKESK